MTYLSADFKMWSAEFQLLQYQIPAIETEVLDEHSDKVLHVAVAH